MATYIRLPLVSLNASRLRVPERIATTVQVDLTSSLLVAGNCSTTDAVLDIKRCAPAAVGATYQ